MFRYHILRDIFLRSLFSREITTVTQLHRLVLGTPKEAKITYCLHETGAWLMGDRFLPSYISNCLRIVEGRGDVHKFLLLKECVNENVSEENRKILLARAEDTIKWAKQTREQEYHEVHTLVFLSEWAAQEAGNENVIAAILETIEPAAIAAAEKFKKDRYNIADWPWAEETCLEIAQKLDQKAKGETPNGGWDIAARLTVLFGWLGVSINVKPAIAAKYNEASMLRNVVVHRYGRLGPADAANAPHLSEWIGKTVPMTSSRFDEFHEAIIGVHLKIWEAVQKNGWK
jgi:hypothetical protein